MASNSSLESVGGPRVTSTEGAAVLTRTLWGVSANLMRLAIHFGQQVVLVPFYLTAWGAAGFGDWLVLTSTAAYLAFADIGVQTYFVNRMNAEWNRGNKLRFHVLFHTALVFYIFEVTGLGLLLAAIAYRVPWQSVFHLSVTNNRASAAVVVFAGAAMLITIPAWLVLGVYRCVGEYARSVTLVNAAQVTNIVLTAIALVLRARPETVALLLIVPPCIYTTCGVFDLRRRYPEIRFGVRYASSRVLRRSVTKSAYFVLIPFSQALWLQGPMLAISVTLGSAAVVAFSVTRTLFLFIRQFMVQITQAVSPEITVLFARGELSALRRLHSYLSRISLIAAAAVAAYLLVMCPTVIAWWTSGRVEADPSVIKLFAIYMISAALWSGSYIIPLSVNRHGGVSVAFLLMAASTALLSFVLAPFLGVPGAAAALIIGDWWLVIKVSRVVSELLGRGSWNDIIAGLKFSLAAFTLVLISTAVMNDLVSGSRLPSIVATVLPAAAATLLVGVFAVPRRDRDLLVLKAAESLSVLSRRSV